MPLRWPRRSFSAAAARRRVLLRFAAHAYATLDDFDGSFQFCRIVFTEASNGDGGGWNVDFPRADENLSIRLSELTKTPVGMDTDDVPKHLLINLRQPELSHCPFIMMTEVGRLSLNDDEAANLRDYLLKGGFLWADDFWGECAWDFFESQMRRALPRGELSDRRSAARPSALSRADGRESHSADSRRSISGAARAAGRPNAAPRARRRTPAPFSTSKGRVMVFITHNTDFGDAFEREGDNHEYFIEFSVPGYAVGVNVLLYAMTHCDT